MTVIQFPTGRRTSAAASSSVLTTGVMAGVEAIEAYKAATTLSDRLVEFSRRFHVAEMRDPGNRSAIELLSIDHAVARLLSTDLRTLPEPGKVIWALGATDPAMHFPMPGGR